MKIKFKLLSVLVVLLLCFNIIDVHVSATVSNNTEVVEADESKVYSQAVIEDEFAGDGILIVLNEEVSKEFKTYTQDDFSEFGVSEIHELTSAKAKEIEEISTEKKDKSVQASFLNAEDEEPYIEGFRNILYLKLEENSKEKVLELIDILEKNEDFYYVGPDYYVEIYVDPNDSDFDEQWGLTQIQAPRAWNIENTASVVVGIIDTGIQGGHSDLVNRVGNSLHRDFTTGATNGVIVTPENLEDPNGHGTHVAGIIGAQTDNATGIAGVCWDVELVSLRALGENGTGQVSHVINAINYAEDTGIDILNISLGSSNMDTALETAVKWFSGLIVAAAGNNDENTDVNANYPSCFNNYENVISVGASDQNDERSNWNSFTNLWGFLGGRKSNYGKNTVDIFAPGSNIYSSLNTGGYGKKSGTSMAAPFVSGVAALMMSVNPSLEPGDIKAILNLTADRKSGLTDMCVSGGRINAYEAIAHAVYAERVAIPNNNSYTEMITSIEEDGYKDYVIHFATSGTRVIQTFGESDTYLELYNADGTLLLGQADTDDKGYSVNAMLSYSFNDSEAYIIRIKAYDSSMIESVKLAIVPTYSHENYESAYGPYGITTVGWSLSTGYTALFRYQFSTSGDVIFTLTGDAQTYLCVIDPTSTEPLSYYNGGNASADCLYGTGSVSTVRKSVIPNRQYLVIISFKFPNYTSGDFLIETTTP